MTDRPIIFSAAMVRALLDGRKTQTRRVLRDDREDLEPPHVAKYASGACVMQIDPVDGNAFAFPGAAGAAVGDRLWVREAFAEVGAVDPPWTLYRASGYDKECARHGFDRTSIPPERTVRWRPSIHMPRAISRTTLIVTDVRVQRLQEISETDAMAEGVDPVLVPPDGGSCPHVEGFRDLWNSLHAKRPERLWDANPWVCAPTFRVIHQNIDERAT